MPFKENLMSALHEAVNLRNGGEDDNAAVAKVASDYRFNQEQTRRLVETYNTAKTIHFYKAAEDRSGEFPLADPDVVLGTMVDFDRTPKKTATAAVGLHDYTEYDRPETDWLNGEEKAAEALFTEESDPYQDLDINSVTSNLIKKAAEIRRSAEHCRNTAGICTEKYARALDRMTTFVQRSHGAGRPEAYGELCGHLHAGLGKEAAQRIIHDLEEWLHPLYREKNAMPKFSTFSTDYPEQAEIAKEASIAIQGYAEMEAAAQQFDKMASDFETTYDDTLFGEVKAANHDWTDEFIPEGTLDKAAQAGVFNVVDLLPGGNAEGNSNRGSSDGLSSAITGTVGKGVAGAVTPAVTDAFVPKGPASELESLQERLRNLQRQQILEDLMTNDEVIAGEDPDKVIQAYQAILQTAPHVSTNREVVRSILRQASQAASISPFDAKSWADLENQIAKQTQAPRRAEV